MRKAFVMMLLAGVCSSAAAAWIEVNRDETTTDYLDPTTIRKAGNMVKMWSLTDYKTAQVADGKPYISSRQQNEYDCKGERVRILSLSAHSGNMAGGETVFVGTDPSKWVPIAPGAIMETLWKIACGKR